MSSFAPIHYNYSSLCHVMYQQGSMCQIRENILIHQVERKSKKQQDHTQNFTTPHCIIAKHDFLVTCQQLLPSISIQFQVVQYNTFQVCWFAPMTDLLLCQSFPESCLYLCERVDPQCGHLWLISSGFYSDIIFGLFTTHCNGEVNPNFFH